MKNADARGLALALTLVTAGMAACDTGTAPAGRPVTFFLAAQAPSLRTGSGGPLELDSLRLVVIEASLGSGDQFGCVDCSGQESQGPAPALVAVAPGGGPVELVTEQVQPSRYSEVEVTVGRAPTGLGGATSTWPTGASIEIVGRINGSPFSLTLPIEGTFREQLAAPVEVTAAGSTPVGVTVTLPVEAWFVGSGGAMLDPRVPAQRAQIEANARRSFGPVENAGRGEDR